MVQVHNRATSVGSIKVDGEWIQMASQQKILLDKEPEYVSHGTVVSVIKPPVASTRKAEAVPVSKAGKKNKKAEAPAEGLTVA